MVSGQLLIFEVSFFQQGPLERATEAAGRYTHVDPKGQCNVFGFAA